ncbi:MAG: alpha/beta fold hydrolase [Alphaproteobacteria bacterium]
MPLSPANFVNSAHTPFPAGGKALWLERETGARLRVGVFDRGEADKNWLLLLHGRSEFIEKYAEVIIELHARGFDVVTMDWRGQGLSNRPLPDDPMKGHIDDFQTYFDDLDALWAELLVEELSISSALPVLAHSMGGHISLRYAALNPGKVAKLAATAPMVDLPTMGLPKWVARGGAKLLCKIRGAEPYFLGQRPQVPEDFQFALNTVTKDEARFSADMAWLKACPQLALGGPTLGWVAAAIASIEETERTDFGPKLSMPILLASARADRVVPCAAHDDLAARLPNGTLLKIEGSEHEVLRERDAIRAEFFKAFDGFMAA